MRFKRKSMEWEEKEGLGRFDECQHSRIQLEKYELAKETEKKRIKGKSEEYGII